MGNRVSGRRRDRLSASFDQSLFGESQLRAEILISLAAAHGVDLEKAARTGAPARDVISQRFDNGRRASVLIEPPTTRTRGRNSRSFARPAWTTQEIAQACVGVPELEFRAALFAFAGDGSGYRRLIEALHCEARKLQVRHQWPERVADIHGIPIEYTRHLAKQVLDLDQHPNLFHTVPALHWIYLNTTEKVWERHLTEPFNAIQLEWLRWIGSAAATIQARLRDDDEP
jgi:hypothetical protein